MRLTDNLRPEEKKFKGSLLLALAFFTTTALLTKNFSQDNNNAQRDAFHEKLKHFVTTNSSDEDTGTVTHTLKMTNDTLAYLTYTAGAVDYCVVVIDLLTESKTEYVNLLGRNIIKKENNRVVGTAKPEKRAEEVEKLFPTHVNEQADEINNPDESPML